MRSLARVSEFASGRRSRWVVIGLWVATALALAPLQPNLQEEAADESDTFLVRGSESADAERVVDERFRAGSQMAAVIAYFREGGITSADRARIQADALEICRSARIPSLALVGTPYGLACGEQDPLDLSPGPGLLISSDASVVLGSALMTDESTQVAEAAAAAIRSVVPPPSGDETGLRAYVTGEAGYDADRSAAVEGIDDTLLIVTVAVLLMLLLLIYRSPLVAAVPLVVVALAYLIAAGLIYALVAAGATTVSGQTTAILIVLMFGVGTDYCLLIVARYRDELRTIADAGTAMARATERTGPAILTAGAIVVAAMLVLAVADLNATREMGPLLALGVAVMVAAGLTLLPAILAALGRRAFWPAIPAVEPEARPAPPVWRRVADLVARRPVGVAAAGFAVLVAGALGNLGGRETLDFSEQFRERPESVEGQELIQERFGVGRAAPVQVVTDFEVAEPVIGQLAAGLDTPVGEMYLMARSVSADGTVGAAPAPGDLGLAEGYLRIDPFSDEASDSIPGLRRTARDAADGAPVLVGGPVAEAYDTREALQRDTWLIVPITLALVLAILAVLLRALVMPLYVIATVLLSFAFALGAGSLAFTHLFDQPASDPSLPLFAFIFLVALGVDYNVFLLARIREERARGVATAAATTRALERTGGVITSAGLVLAATFSVLMALELEALFQVGFVVALGLLVDTFLVRALIVPALAVRFGERNWWPAAGFQGEEPASPGFERSTNKSL
jgi:RND superfamily putative drug exporter